MLKLVSAIAIVAAAVLMPSRAAAEPSPRPAWHGIWQGSIGSRPVRVCFVQTQSNAFGAYYYLSSLRSIALDHPDRGGTFVEGDGTEPQKPRWVLDDVKPNGISGRWTQAERTLPIRLTRIAEPAASETPCTSMLFLQPRLAGIRVVTKRARKDGTAYTRLILDHRGHFPETRVESFALDGSSGSVRRINAKLRAPLSGNPPEWFDCIRNAIGQSGRDGDTDEMLAPRLISARWLTVIHHQDGDCGGAHPNSANLPRTFDRASGQEIDLHDWLNDTAIKRTRYPGDSDDIKTLRPAFRAFILGRWKPDDAECGDPVRAQEFWDIELTRTGLVFTPQLAHVVQACGEDFAVPFARLRPYLSAAGLANIASMRAEAPATH
ncbi:MAG: hypothetical protein JWO81_1426 [Alphaproteobacteria bacterium]|nr:hypothetical protein [Alphaproteobacteria bacterium]